MFLPLLLAAAAAAPAAPAVPAPTEFPSPASALSPDGRWALVSQSDAGADVPHALVLRDTRTGARSLLHRFEKALTVRWAPDSRAVAITDRTATGAECLVLRPDWISLSIASFAEALAAARPADAAAAGRPARVECGRWTSPTTLEVGTCAAGPAAPARKAWRWSPGGAIEPLPPGAVPCPKS